MEASASLVSLMTLWALCWIHENSTVGQSVQKYMNQRGVEPGCGVSSAHPSLDCVRPSSAKIGTDREEQEMSSSALSLCRPIGSHRLKIRTVVTWV